MVITLVVEYYSDGAFPDSQPVIETVKKDVPVYHTQIMRKEMFNLFGRLTSSLKSALLDTSTGSLQVCGVYVTLS